MTGARIKKYICDLLVILEMKLRVLASRQAGRAVDRVLMSSVVTLDN